MTVPARLWLLLALALAAFAPAPFTPAARADASRAPVVLAAASLQESLGAAADAWARHGHPRPVISFAASSALARQVEAGAPADLFVSADEAWMDYLAQRRLVRPETRLALLTNRLVLVAPAGSPVRLSIGPRMALGAALGSGRLAVADPDSVPAGRYAREALTRLGAWPQVARRLARGENVRAALALVARGEAPLGIVYATDARAEPRVRVVGTFPPASHAPISYPLARLARSANPEGEAFRRYLLSPEARALFRRFGFGTR
ncbi:molybdate ABC transporter substrate-binding protein [Novosphingobium bradum]|uniref:Molybdate ABC transporter substrate-binding protein n=1 Tax=Novosphingobium bradum TaxID=1737444 RepID=A0ABV7IST1_9SPHN